LIAWRGRNLFDYHTLNIAKLPLNTMPKRKNHRRGGRPVTTGSTPMIGLRLARDWVARVDAYAAKREVHRSDAIRMLLEKALASETGEPAEQTVGVSP